jgi:hypothetical protein
MTVTFLVALNIDDVTAASAVAEDLNDDLSGLGYDVTSVRPWHRDSLATASPLQSPPLGAQAGLPTTL